MSGMFSSLFGGGGSAKRAAAVQAAGYKTASNMVGDRYNQVSQNYTPYMNAGTSALENYTRLAGGLEGATGDLNNVAKSMDPIVAKITSGDLSAYQNSPAYDFRMQEQQKVLERSAVANHTAGGAADKALARFGQDYGSNEYQNYLNNLYQQLNSVNTQISGRQAGLNGMYQNLDAYSPIISNGMNAADAQARMGMGAAETQGNYAIGRGDVLANGMTTKANQMQASGQQWLGLASAAAGAGMAGMAPGGMSALQGMQVGGALGGNSALAGMNGADMWSQARNSSTSSYQPYQMGAYDPSLPWKR